MVPAVYEFNDSISSYLGFPVKVNIFYNWLRVELPGKTGLPTSISAKIQPTDQISALLS